MSDVVIKAGNPETGQKITEADFEELNRLLKKDCINEILADSRVSASEYVERYNAGRGGE